MAHPQITAALAASPSIPVLMKRLTWFHSWLMQTGRMGPWTLLCLGASAQHVNVDVTVGFLANALQSPVSHDVQCLAAPRHDLCLHDKRLREFRLSGRHSGAPGALARSAIRGRTDDAPWQTDARIATFCQTLHAFGRHRRGA